jgi:ribosomal protein S12 methylthiotransferase
LNLEKVKSFHITTLGCPKNVADSTHMYSSLIQEGLVEEENPEKADFHLINTCTFIKSATEETIETILNAGKVKKKENQKLVVVGCFAERYPNEIKTDMPEVDLVFGTGKYSQAGKLIRENFPEEFQNLKEINLYLQEREFFPKNNKPYSYVKVSDGCNRGCHFCIIPNLRGNFKDAKESQILEDSKNAIKFGAKEICIVSQDTVFYGKDTNKLKDILNEISVLDGLEILRLLYLYPDKKTFNLLDLVLENQKIAPYFESPIQHVSEKVLKSMNRTGSFSFFKELFSKARQRENLEIRTSIILGYPGEKPEDVDLVLKFIEEVKPEKLALFAFSPQEGTQAFKLKSDVSKKEAARRVNLVREAHLEVLKDIHLNRIGKIYPCIVDEIEEGKSIARRFQDAPEIDEVVFIENQNLKIGQIGKLRIDSFSEYDMDGTWIDEPKNF